MTTTCIQRQLDQKISTLEERLTSYRLCLLGKEERCATTLSKQMLALSLS
jgi:hypothetical protein